MIWKSALVAILAVTLWVSGCTLDAGCSCGKEANEYGFVVHEASCTMFDPQTETLAEKLAELERTEQLSTLSEEDRQLWDELIVP